MVRREKELERLRNLRDTKLIHLAKNTTARLQCADQDIFNIFFDNNNYVAFDRAYNFSPKYHSDAENFKIIHYCFDKPWENRECACSEYFGA
jgi:lipopolysaccharide biosynthesis glycosyltransferase